MKLESYRILCAMKAGDYIAAGSIMAEHFRVPEIARVSSTLSPAVELLNTKHELDYMMYVAFSNTSYYWYNTIGFVGPNKTVARPQHYQAFDVWVKA